MIFRCSRGPSANTGHVAATAPRGISPCFPLALPEVSLQYEQDGRSVIRLRFECSPLAGDGSQIDLSRLPLYLNADSPLACALHRALTLGVQQIWFRLPGRNVGHWTAIFPRWGSVRTIRSGQKANRPSAATNYCWSISPSARSLCLSPSTGWRMWSGRQE